ncbi:MAG: ATP-binding protein [Gallionella sp.]|nr:ATP-binding protein [Gallionella sp.]
MSNIIQIRQPLSGKQGFPLRLFAGAFVISLLTTVFSGWQSWRLHTQAEEMSRKHIALTENIGRIMLFDEVLTMSARMAAATGDFSYEKRYDQFDLQLTAQISEIRDLLPQSEIALFVGETDEANLALVKLERQAFAWAHQGRRQEATALLTSAEYMRLKKVYARGMEKTANAATTLIEREAQSLHSMSLWLALASAVSTIVLLATWFFAIRSARNWAAERREAEDTLRKTQDELVRREKLAVLGQVAGSVGHELRNPLGVMSNAVYFLQTVLSDADDSVKEYLNIIKDEIASSERIVSDLLDSVRTKPPQPEAVGVREIIQMTLGKLTIPAAVSIKLDIPETLPVLRVDAQQIHQVFRNLVSNSVEAMPDGGTLQIKAEADAATKKIIVSVRDSGVGMTTEQLEHLFQPLFTTKARGIGLGLVVVKNLTEANGGSIQVQSAPEKGSMFTVTLPAG